MPEGTRQIKEKEQDLSLFTWVSSADGKEGKTKGERDSKMRMAR